MDKSRKNGQGNEGTEMSTEKNDKGGGAAAASEDAAGKGDA